MYYNGDNMIRCVCMYRNGDLPAMQIRTDMSQLTDGKEGKFHMALKIVSNGATHETEFAKATVYTHTLINMTI